MALIASLEAAAQAGRATPWPGPRSRLPQPIGFFPEIAGAFWDPHTHQACPRKLGPLMILILISMISR